MTLIRVTHSDGTSRRCDSRCYNATNKRCECVCGGMNHGVGTEKAVENTREMALALFGQDERGWACLAYRDDGRLCGRLAVAVDPERGIPVCRHHAQTALVRTEGREPRR